jgi:hypothetical protein
MDTFVDWIITGGYPVEKIDDYPSWLTRFETATRALPERQRAQSVLAVLDVYREPMLAIAGSPVPGARFRSAVEHSGRLVRGRHSLGTNGAAGRRPGGRRRHQEIPGTLEGIADDEYSVGPRLGHRYTGRAGLGPYARGGRSAAAFRDG